MAEVEEEITILFFVALHFCCNFILIIYLLLLLLLSNNMLVQLEKSGANCNREERREKSFARVLEIKQNTFHK